MKNKREKEKQLSLLVNSEIIGLLCLVYVACSFKMEGLVSLEYPTSSIVI